MFKEKQILNTLENIDRKLASILTLVKSDKIKKHNNNYAKNKNSNKGDK